MNIPVAILVDSYLERRGCLVRMERYQRQTVAIYYSHCAELSEAPEACETWPVQGPAIPGDKEPHWFIVPTILISLAEMAGPVHTTKTKTWVGLGS